ncbi:YfhO family protein [candidate division KSB1 bacterium]|nr:YfhO family protein [candidate division KSB1 bacterium]
MAKKKRKAAKTEEKRVTRHVKPSIFNQKSRTFDLLAIGGFLVLVVVLFREFLFSDGMLFGTDTIAAGVMFRTFYANFVRQFHQMPLWQPYLLGGMPFVDAMHGDTFYPLAFLKFFIPIHRALGLKLVLSILLAGVGMYYYIKSLGIDRKVAFLGGVVYLLAADLVTLVYAGHDSKIYIMSLLPFVFMVLEKALGTGRFINFTLLGGLIGLMILSSHMQLAYYSMWAVGLYFLYRIIWSIKKKEEKKLIFKISIFFILALIIGVGFGLVQFLSPYPYLGNFSKRAGPERSTYEWATSWSIHPEEVASLVVPGFVNFLDDYWGKNPFRLNCSYLGILPLFFSILAIFYFRDRRAIVFSCLGLLMLINALGATTPFYRIFYHLVPGVKKFRACGMSMFVFSFLMVVVGGIGLNKVIHLNLDKVKREKLIKGLGIALGVFLGLMLLTLIAGSSLLSIWKSVFYSQILPDKAQIMRENLPNFKRGFFISSLFLSGGIWLTISKLKGKFSNQVFLFTLVPIVIIDLWRIDTKFVKVVDFQGYFRKDSAIEFLQKEREPFRCFPLPGTYPYNHLALFGIEEVAGHHGNELRWYDEFVGGNYLTNLTYRLQKNDIGGNPFLNLLNVRYLLYRPEKNEPVKLIKNRGYLPRAFTVSRYEVLQGKEGVLSRIKDPNFDYRNTIILEEDPQVNIDPQDTTGSPGKVEIFDNRINSFKVKADMKRPGFLFLSENYYPAWRAWVDGKETKIYRADYTFRAVYLDEGKHIVRFVFDSKPYMIGKWVSILTLIFIIGCIAWELKRSRKLAKLRLPDRAGKPRRGGTT